jgi:hypothetical protein
VVKQRLQAKDSASSSIRDRSALLTARRIVRADGWRGLYRGWLAGVLTSAPFAGTYFLLYESFKATLLPLAVRVEDSVWGRGLVRSSSSAGDTAVLEQTDPMSPTPSSGSVPQVLLMPTHLLSGFCAGLIGAALTNPVDVARTRIQVESASTAGAYRGISDALVRIAREEGASAFFKGISARMMWMAPGAAIGIAACAFSVGWVVSVFWLTIEYR